MCGAGFNEIMSLTKKIDRLEKSNTTIFDFRMALSDYELHDMGFTVPMITWFNKSVTPRVRSARE